MRTGADVVVVVVVVDVAVAVVVGLVARSGWF